VTRVNKILIASLAIFMFASCANDPNQRAKIGAGLGAVAGAAAGAALGEGKGALIGGAVGALAGGAVGHYMDNQQRDFEAELAAERSQHELDIERMRRYR